MKRLLILLGFIYPFALHAQQILPYLDVNQVKTPILSRGEIGWDLGAARYEVPKGSGKKPLFNSAVWIGGIADHNLHMAAQTYRQSGNDFYPGPLDTTNGICETIKSEEYNRIWKVNRSEINTFKTNYANGNVSNGTYTIPSSILLWPGSDSGNYSKRIAPYVDVNADGKYRPLDGDYPDIKGDQALFTVFNDHTASESHNETQALPMGTEVRLQAYAYNCATIADSDAVLNHTTFYQYKFINRSTNTYTATRIALWVDVDLGNYSDDFIECNPKEGYAYVMNGDSMDEGGYGSNPPAFSTVMLSSPGSSLMSGFQYYTNDFGLMGNPTRPEHYWNYMNNYWKDGMPVTYGGNGRGGSTGANFMFPGKNDLSNRPEWSESSASNTPGDRRYIIVMGPFTFAPGEMRELEFAFVFSQPQQPSLFYTQMDRDVKRIRTWYDNRSFPSCGLSNGMDEASVEKLEVSVYPNPVKDKLFIGGGTHVNAYAIYTITGALQEEGTVSGTISTQNLEAGVYLLHLNTAQGKVIKRFVKQ